MAKFRFNSRFNYITLYRALGGDWAVNQSVGKSAAPTAAGK